MWLFCSSCFGEWLLCNWLLGFCGVFSWWEGVGGCGVVCCGGWRFGVGELLILMALISSAINSSPEDRSVGCHVWVVGEVAGRSRASLFVGSSNGLVRDCCCPSLFWIPSPSLGPSFSADRWFPVFDPALLDRVGFSSGSSFGFSSLHSFNRWGVLCVCGSGLGVGSGSHAFLCMLSGCGCIFGRGRFHRGASITFSNREGGELG